MSIQWLDGAGQAQLLPPKPGVYNQVRLSPDGQRMALRVTTGSNRDIWVYEWQRDTMTRLTFGGIDTNPVWIPDGRYLVYTANGGMFWQKPNPSRPVKKSNATMTSRWFLRA